MNIFDTNCGKTNKPCSCTPREDPRMAHIPESFEFSHVAVIGRMIDTGSSCRQINDYLIFEWNKLDLTTQRLNLNSWK